MNKMDSDYIEQFARVVESHGLPLSEEHRRHGVYTTRQEVMDETLTLPAYYLTLPILKLVLKHVQKYPWDAKDLLPTYKMLKDAIQAHRQEHYLDIYLQIGVSYNNLIRLQNEPHPYYHAISTPSLNAFYLKNVDKIGQAISSLKLSLQRQPWKHHLPIDIACLKPRLSTDIMQQIHSYCPPAGLGVGIAFSPDVKRLKDIHDKQVLSQKLYAHRNSHMFTKSSCAII